MPKHPIRDIVLASSLTLSIAACATPDDSQSWDHGGAAYDYNGASGVTTYGLPLPELSGDDRDALGRIAYAEAGNQGDMGVAAVIYTILNRVNSGQFQSTVQDVIDARNQFEPATRVGGWRYLPPLNTWRSSQFDSILDLILTGQLPDPTNGALYFQNARIVAARAARGKGSWSLVDFGGTPPVAEIGDHRFYDWRAAINLAAARARPVYEDSEPVSSSEVAEYSASDASSSYADYAPSGAYSPSVAYAPAAGEDGGVADAPAVVEDGNAAGEVYGWGAGEAAVAATPDDSEQLPATTTDVQEEVSGLAYAADDGDSPY